MALELLSGPHAIVNMATGSNVAGISQMLWVDPVGLIAPASSIGTVLVQMDGSAAAFTPNVGYMSYGLQLVNGNPAAPDVGQLWYSMKAFDPGIASSDYMLDRTTLVRRAPAIRTNAPGSLGFFARVHDRYIDVGGNHVRYWPSPTGSDSPEATLTGMSDAASMSWARERGHIWIGGSTGKVVRYDYVNKVASSPVYQIGLTSAVYGLFYSAKHDVFISMHQTGGGVQEIHVWARTPLPTTLSAPTASPSVAAGRAVTLTTRVLGAHSDPCPNEVVTWALTGEGELESEFTATDASGYAHNRLVLPVAAAGPSVQVDVELATP